MFLAQTPPASFVNIDAGQHQAGIFQSSPPPKSKKNHSKNSKNQNIILVSMKINARKPTWDIYLKYLKVTFYYFPKWYPAENVVEYRIWFGKIPPWNLEAGLGKICPPGILVAGIKCDSPSPLAKLNRGMPYKVYKRRRKATSINLDKKRSF